MLTNFALITLYGCNNDIAIEYALRKDEILQTAPELSPNWKPDIILRLNYEHLSDIAEILINEQLRTAKSFNKDFMGVSLKVVPKLQLEELELSDAPDGDHINIQGVIRGPLKTTVANLSTTERTRIQFSGSVNTFFENGQVFLKIDELPKLNVQINEFKLGFMTSINIGGPLEDWLRREILDTPPIPLKKFDLPFRGARLTSTPNAEHIEIRTNVNHNNNIQTPDGVFDEDWEAWIHQDTLLGWAQEKAIELGNVGYGVVIDPVDIDIQQQDFELDLRLWKVQGRGQWWRDYTALGSIEQRNKKIALIANSVEETGKSKRAGLVDPLALLAEGFILEAIAENLHQSLPSQQSKTNNAHKWSMVLKEWNGEQEALKVSGAINMTTSTTKERSKNK